MRVICVSGDGKAVCGGGDVGHRGADLSQLPFTSRLLCSPPVYFLRMRVSSKQLGF